MQQFPSSIKVKIIARGQDSYPWKKQIPGNTGVWNNCQFIFDHDQDNYDWLVVIDDLSRGYTSQPEAITCADEHTLLVTTEPPTITRYGRSFAAQFEHVLTSQSEHALPHSKRIHSHTGNLWFNGQSYNEIVDNGIPKKNATLSTVCSSKQQRHTIHKNRYDFTYWLKQKLPELDIFGHGVRFVQNKYEAMNSYRYHLAIENYIGPHHWTEKLSDPYLSGAVPIYYGCPNIDEYFPKDSYIAIDINNREAAYDIIKSCITDPQDYANRLDALREAQRLVLDEYNLLAMLDQIISTHYSSTPKTSGRLLYNRKQMRYRHPLDLISHLYWGAKRHLNTQTKQDD
jgi:hypothetical protein